MASRPSLVLPVDVVLVVVFAAIGRATHDGDVLGPGGSGLSTTAWPFVVALLIGWAVTRAWRHPLSVRRAGLPIWAITVVVGMLLRAVSGQGIALAFVIVATITLGLLLLGWRLLAVVVSRAVRGRRPAH